MQPDPAAASLHEIVTHFHLEHGAHTRVGVDITAMRVRIAQADEHRFLRFRPAGSSTDAKAATTGKFKFLHLTDTHIQPELHAVDGCRMCFSHAHKSRADFALIGGDLVFDAAEQKHDRAKFLYAMYAETVKRIEMPVYSALGNHDVFGTSPASGIDKSDPAYGKKMFEDRIGPRYQSFDHKGIHFVILDSIELTPDGKFSGGIDADQIAWLKTDLEKTGKAMPVVVTTHVPLVSGAVQILDAGANWQGLLVRNARQVLDILWQSNLKMVLQGHTHIVEKVEYNGCAFITGGAVSGNWWKGKRLFHPEGYGLIEVADGKLSWSYQTYGFVADAAV